MIVASSRGFSLNYFDIRKNGSLEPKASLRVGTVIDNIEPDEDGNLWIGAHPNLLAFASYAAGKRETAPSEIIKVSNSKEVESMFEDDGNLISAISLAARYKDLLFVGTVMDDYILVLKTEG